MPGKPFPPLQLTAFVISDLNLIIPSRKITHNHWFHIQKFNLADPEFNIPQPINILIGADIYGLIILDKIRRGLPHEPIAIQTIFGWAILGSTPSSSQLFKPIINGITSNFYDDNLTKTLQSFWEQEEVSLPKITSKEDQEC